MKTINKVILSGLSVFALSTSAFADNISDDVRDARSSVDALGIQLESMRVNVNTQVDTSGALTHTQKLSLYQEKHAELQGIFNSVHFSS
ncbi:hypothetical protein [Marinomonas mediterranea]|jgi:hypothetical protein|uniref:Uncharacterized protein n=1 Tax=Marinomonas mediterranea (strain ATCC 700492 / JCM 21426 / NBRC 103028 / MMB-1) TaxID=717774 RepID=F2JUV4_MARM1|nr:hypothetical protein [Marinomonas mediterranea]ADZ90519.1 hypothetical protein Marme_1246 [Marinomonas mediterranea MMB-1]WCN16698.1 hypothetical protein GV053_06305 [Marinomonas mediterranea MMB-1]